MAGTKEILDRIGSIRETMKVTNAMYLISSSKIRKARERMNEVQAYYDAICSTIGDILAQAPELEHRYLEQKPKSASASALAAKASDSDKHSRHAYLVITADKGLAGAYNLNVIRHAEAELRKYPDSRLFVIGQIGLHYFAHKQYDVRPDFSYTSQNPNLQRARYIASDLMDEFEDGRIDEIYVIYTRMKNALQSEDVMMKLMPLSRDAFSANDETLRGEESFYPDAKSVFTQIAPLTMQGVIFTALTESWCAELNDRMTAMRSASDNASKMIQELELDYNRRRQGSITQEITEIIAGASALKSDDRM